MIKIETDHGVHYDATMDNLDPELDALAEKYLNILRVRPPWCSLQTTFEEFYEAEKGE